MPYTLISVIQNFASHDSYQTSDVGVAALTTLFVSTLLYRNRKKMNFFKRWMLKMLTKKLLRRMHKRYEGADVLGFLQGFSIIGLLVVGTIMLWAGGLVFLGLVLIGAGLILAGFYIG